MLTALGRLRAAGLACIAAAGLVAGHSLTYSWLPSGTVRPIHALAPAHRYLEAVFVLGPLVLMALALTSLLGALEGSGRRRSSYSWPVLLGGVQVAGFALQEVLERMVYVVPAASLWKILLVGVPTQLLVAAVASLLVIGLHKAGSAFARLVRARLRPRRRNPTRRLGHGTVSPTLPALAAPRGRAPPQLL